MMPGFFIAVVFVALLVAGGVVGMVLLLGKGLEPPARARVRWLAAAFVAVVAGGLTAAMYAQIYYSIPITVMVALLAIWAAAGLLAMDIAKLVGRSVRTFAILLAIFVSVALVSTVVGMLAPFGAPEQLFLVRAQQIAEANGFVALLPEGEEMISDYLPIEAVGENEDTLAIEYKRFRLEERAAEGEMNEADLRALVARGVQPMEGGAIVPEDAESAMLVVAGRPAVGVSFTYVPPEVSEKNSQVAKSENVSMLVTAVGDVQVLLHSQSHMAYTGEGSAETYEEVPALTFAELVAIAEKLQPIE